MVDYTDIRTELDTNWNAGVIAKPTFKEGMLSNTPKYPGVVFIQILSGALIKPSAINGSLEPRETSFLITIYAKDRADTEKYIGEVRRIINVKSIAGGWWRINSIPRYSKVRKRYVAALQGAEKLMIAASGWS